MGMDDPYYSVAPTMIVHRPVALVGFMGAGVPLIGATLSALTGLPFIDLDRHVEHDAGTSLARLARERGVDVLAAHERRVLSRVIREQPPPIVALGHAVLAEEKTRRLLAGKVHLIYIRRPLPVLHRTLARELEQQGVGRYWPLAQWRPDRPEALAGLLGVHRPHYEAADHTVDASDAHPQRVARAVLRYLEASSSGASTTAVP